MKLPQRPPRTPSTLPESVHQQLNLYTLAATAAGASLLALAQPSEAKVIYTKTYKLIGTNGFYGLDLNHDSIIDFIIQESGAPFSWSGNNALAVKEAYGNGVMGSNKLASALGHGAPIGPKQHFLATSSALGEVMAASGCSADGGCSSDGKWRNVTNRYLGLKFKIVGKTHYGWARLNVQIQAGHDIVAILTGYAYETIPRKEIKAGQTKETESFESDSSTQPSFRQRTLGHLALGTLRVSPGGSHD